MFRKPKRKAKDSLRRKVNTQDEGGQIDNTDDLKGESASTTSELISEARKRVKGGNSTSSAVVSTTSGAPSSGSDVMHSFQSSDQIKTAAELVTSTAEHHPVDKEDGSAGVAGVGEDGIFRNKKRNKMWAGPIRAAQHVRVTARFDYQPDICKDYKETGFCGFGDTCIYLHDRGDTLTGWQLEQQWEEQQRRKKEKQERELDEFVQRHAGGKAAPAAADGASLTTDDGLPFACHICRDFFKDPVVTNCQHYFCQNCILTHIRTVNESCPVCSQDTNSVFNQPTKLIAKKRRLLGSSRANEKGSWEAFFKSFSGQPKLDT